MNIVICGAGQVGSHAAEVLAGLGHSVTVIDERAERLSVIEDSLDVGTLCGNCATAETLRMAGGSAADLVVAATHRDEINLLTASVAKGIGAAKTIARVHHRTFFDQRGLDYQSHFSIDQLICPEYSTARAIARTLRNPGALAIEDFARGMIEMHEFPVSPGAAAVGKPLADVHLPKGTRLAVIRHNGQVFLPTAQSTVHGGDIVILVGNAEAFQQARKLFRDEKTGRRRVVIMGGPAMVVWLCRALRDRDFALRIFEVNRERAEELAEKLEWVTVINADPTDRNVFDEEHLEKADAFVALLNDDEHNILGCAWAKSLGVKEAIAVVQHSNYDHLLSSVGIDRSFSPRTVAVRDIVRFIDTRSIQALSSLAEGVVDVYAIRTGPEAEVVGKALRDIRLAPNWVIAAIQHGSEVKVPSADDSIEVGDRVLVIGRHGREDRLRKLFAAS